MDRMQKAWVSSRKARSRSSSMCLRNLVYFKLSPLFSLVGLVHLLTQRNMKNNKTSSQKGIYKSLSCYLSFIHSLHHLFNRYLINAKIIPAWNLIPLFERNSEIVMLINGNNGSMRYLKCKVNRVRFLNGRWEGVAPTGNQRFSAVHWEALMRLRSLGSPLQRCKGRRRPAALGQRWGGVLPVS